MIRIVDSPDALGAIAADLVRSEAAAGRLDVLGVATGSSPDPIYRALASDPPPVDRLELFALDEYVGLPPAHPASYHAVVEATIAGPLGIPRDRVHVPDGSAADLEEAAQGFERRLAASGGVDLQIVGIGANGHLGFNEPGSPLDGRTRVVDLAERTRADNARFFADAAEVPHRAVTQGLATILAARRILLIAIGPAKAEAVARALSGSVSSDCPASVLQTHSDVTVLLDPAAAALLSDQEVLR